MLADNVRRMRKALGLKQGELAAAAGLSQSYLCEIEKGQKKNPPLGTLVKLAAALQTGVATLMGEA